MQIVIYSGSFNPPHIGHLMLANYISQFVDGIDEVWLMVSPQNPLKPLADLAAEEHRLAMARLAALPTPHIRVSDFEFHLPRPSFTYRTLCALRDQYPQHQFRLAIGADNLLNLNAWRNPQEILQEFRPIVYPRPGYELSEAQIPPQVTYLPDAPQLLLSSTFLRQALAQGKDTTFLLPTPAVAQYIHTHGLYTPRPQP